MLEHMEAKSNQEKEYEFSSSESKEEVKLIVLPYARIWKKKCKISWKALMHRKGLQDVGITRSYPIEW